jgi:hypothetical protein
MPKNNDRSTGHAPAEQETDGLPGLNPSRDQILKRLWELANLSPEITRGSIAGQIKAMAMIVAIEGVIPDRRRPANPIQSTAQPTEPSFYQSQWLVERQNQKHEEPSNPDAIAPEPAATLEYPQSEKEGDVVTDPVINPERRSWVPDAVGNYLDPDTSSLRLPLSIQKGHRGWLR